MPEVLDGYLNDVLDPACRWIESGMSVLWLIETREYQQRCMREVARLTGGLIRGGNEIKHEGGGRILFMTDQAATEGKWRGLKIDRIICSSPTVGRELKDRIEGEAG